MRRPASRLSREDQPTGEPPPQENATAVETVSVLFTDVVGSTDLAARVGADRANEAMLEHFSLLREAIAAARGREVKSLGDGLMVVFPSAVAVLRCAVRMQQLLEQRNHRAPDPVAVRIGVSLGDVSRQGGDYFGEPVVQAARLCAHARGDEILCSDLVRLMVGAREELSFSPMGELKLKGLPAPISACEVERSPLGTREHALELPPALRSLPETGLIGRALDAARHRARSGPVVLRRRRRSARGRRRRSPAAGL
jgi:class 3 adenylate cyclase